MRFAHGSSEAPGLRGPDSRFGGGGPGAAEDASARRHSSRPAPSGKERTGHSRAASDLKPQGYVVQTAASAEEAQERLKTLRPDVILLDLHLPGKSGQDILAQLPI